MNMILNPALVAHSLELANRYLVDTRPCMEPVQIPSGPRAWFVLQTTVRGEDKMIEALSDLGFASYSPMMKKDVFNRRQRRVITREFRLFNRYLFAELPLNDRDWRTVRSIDEYHCVLGDHDGPCTVPASEIARFRAAEAASLFDVTKAMRFPIGSRVRVLSGPFGGFSGLVQSLPGRGVVKAMVELLGGLVPVDFAYDMVEPD